MYEDKKSAIDRILKKAEFHRSMRVVQHQSFAVIGVLQECGRPLTLAEIAEALETPTDPHIELCELVSGLLVSGYLDADLGALETRYWVNNVCESRLPLPYYSFRLLLNDYRSN